MPDLDPAVEAAARHIGELSTVSKDRARWFAERAITAAAPLIREQERASVAAEIAEALSTYIGTEANAETLAAVALEHAVAPEHTTPREKP